MRRLHPAVPDDDHRGAASFHSADDGAHFDGALDRAHFHCAHFDPEHGRLFDDFDDFDDFDHGGHHYNGANYQGQARYDDDCPTYNHNATTGYDH